MRLFGKAQIGADAEPAAVASPGDGALPTGTPSGVPGRARRPRGGLVTVGTVIALVVALGLTLFGLGAADHALASANATAWLFSSAKGEVARANGETGRVDTRFKVTDAQGHEIVLSQTDQFLILRDLTTGKVSSLNLATLQLAATTQTTPGLGISVALDADAAFIIDAVQGVVRQLDPLTLNPVGDPLRFPPGLTGGSFDDNGTLWLAVPSEGTVVGIRSAPARHSGGTTAAPGPAIARTTVVADPGHDLALSTLTSGVAVLDQTARTLTTVRGQSTHTVALPLTGAGSMPAHSADPQVPVTVVDDRHVYVVNGTQVSDFAVPGDGPRLEPAVSFAGWLYVADNATGTVYVLDAQGSLVNTIAIPHSGGALELTIRGGHLFINAPNAATARVVDAHHHVRIVDKYANDVLGGDPPANPPPAQPPARPPVGPPGAPGSVQATAGNATVRVSWTAAPANGFAVLSYVVEGDGTAHTVGASQRSITVPGLTNGKLYRFTVYATNAKGAGPKRAANPVTPTRDVPDPPGSVTATEAPDGSVTVTWPAGNGQGHPIAQYSVSAVSAAATAPVGTARGTTLKVPPGALAYGTQFAFTVTSINDKGASSAASPLSNSVVPYTKPGAPAGASAATVDAQGTISANWSAAAANGRAITGYTVTVAGASQMVAGTSVTLTGFGNGATVSVTIAAVNQAGTGPPVTVTARTIDAPAVTAGAPPGPGTNSITVPFTTNTNGGATTCTIAVNGGAAVAIGCSGGPVAGLWPNTAYNYTVTATNKAGSAGFSGSQRTASITGTVICPNNVGGYCNTGIWIYRTPTQNGTAVRALAVGATFTAQCWITGTGAGGNVNATPWGAKNSSIWVRLAGTAGVEYFPWAWTTLSGGDNYRLLPGTPC